MEQNLEKKSFMVAQKQQDDISSILGNQLPQKTMVDQPLQNSIGQAQYPNRSCDIKTQNKGLKLRRKLKFASNKKGMKKNEEKGQRKKRNFILDKIPLYYNIVKKQRKKLRVGQAQHQNNQIENFNSDSNSYCKTKKIKRNNAQKRKILRDLNGPFEQKKKKSRNCYSKQQFVEFRQLIQKIIKYLKVAGRIDPQTADSQLLSKGDNNSKQKELNSQSEQLNLSQVTEGEGRDLLICQNDRNSVRLTSLVLNLVSQGTQSNLDRSLMFSQQLSQQTKEQNIITHITQHLYLFRRNKLELQEQLRLTLTMMVDLKLIRMEHTENFDFLLQNVRKYVLNECQLNLQSKQIRQHDTQMINQNKQVVGSTDKDKQFERMVGQKQQISPTTTNRTNISNQSQECDGIKKDLGIFDRSMSDDQDDEIISQMRHRDWRQSLDQGKKLRLKKQGKIKWQARKLTQKELKGQYNGNLRYYKKYWETMGHQAQKSISMQLRNLRFFSINLGFADLNENGGIKKRYYFRITPIQRARRIISHLKLLYKQGVQFVFLQQVCTPVIRKALIEALEGGQLKYKYSKSLDMNSWDWQTMILSMHPVTFGTIESFYSGSVSRTLGYNTFCQFQIQINGQTKKVGILSVHLRANRGQQKYFQLKKTQLQSRQSGSYDIFITMGDFNIGSTLQYRPENELLQAFSYDVMGDAFNAQKPTYFFKNHQTKEIYQHRNDRLFIYIKEVSNAQVNKLISANVQVSNILLQQCKGKSVNRKEVLQSGEIHYTTLYDHQNLKVTLDFSAYI